MLRHDDLLQMLHDVMIDRDYYTILKTAAAVRDAWKQL